MNSAHTEQIFAEQVAQLYKLMPIGIVATITNSSILTLLLFNLVPRLLLLSWAGSLLIVSIIRSVLYRMALRAISRRTHLFFWSNLFTIGILISGIIWGSAAFFATSHTSDAHRILVAYVLGGMAAGASGTCSSMRQAYLAFSIPALLPQIIVFFTEGEINFIAMGGMLVLFWILITATALTNHTTIKTSFHLRFEREDLIASLKAARKQTEKKNEDLQYEINEKKKAESALREAHDLLEKKVDQRTEELKSANRRLENANRELSDFTHSVSHDLRTPLSSIKNFSVILEEESGDTLNESAKEALFFIKKSAGRMQDIIRDLLQLARAGQMELTITYINMSSIVSEIIETLQLQEPERAVEIIIQPDISALCDPPLIRIVLENLIGNAWKYTGKTEHSRIEFCTIEKDHELIYCISDNGVGFDMKYSENLFAPFKRLHKESAFTGTGIGLATTHKIITRHGGTIWAESSPDQGARFFFTLRGNIEQGI